MPPSGVSRTTICPNSSGVVRALRAHGIGEFLTFGNRLAAHLTGRIHVFWVWRALTISGTVMPSLASWSGLTHSRIAY